MPISVGSSGEANIVSSSSTTGTPDTAPDGIKIPEPSEAVTEPIVDEVALRGSAKPAVAAEAPHVGDEVVFTHVAPPKPTSPFVNSHPVLTRPGKTVTAMQDELMALTHQVPYADGRAVEPLDDFAGRLAQSEQGKPVGEAFTDFLSQVRKDNPGIDLAHVIEKGGRPGATDEEVLAAQAAHARLGKLRSTLGFTPFGTTASSAASQGEQATSSGMARAILAKPVEITDPARGLWSELLTKVMTAGKEISFPGFLGNAAKHI